jgi:hypothetical protein
MSDLSQIIFEESPRTYRTEVPNIVFELLAAREISHNDFVLYCLYRKIAGQSGACWVGTRGLAELTGMSTKTITKSKKKLSQPFQKLNGIGLIHIIPGNKKLETADTVKINDLWRLNDSFFKNKLTCGKRDHTRVVKETTPVWENRPQKNEPIKKEPMKNRSIEKIVHNSAPNPVAPAEMPSVSPPATPAEGSFPFHKENQKQKLY